MAKPRSKGRRSFRRRTFRRGDWVYRDNTYDETGALVEGMGSYSPVIANLTPGPANVQARVLYDSFNYRVALKELGGGTIVQMGQPGRAEGRKAMIHRSQGIIVINPGTWAAGSAIRFGVRFGIWEQDPSTGFIVLDPDWRMMAVSGTDITFHPSYWANWKDWQHERRFATTFSDNSQVWTLKFNFPVRKNLGPNQCYGYLMETTASSVTIQTQHWMRSFVSDEG